MATRYWVGGGAGNRNGTWSSTTSWSATSGGSGGATVPTSADSVVFDQSGTYTVTTTNTSMSSLNVSDSGTGTITVAGNNSNWNVYGTWGTNRLSVQTNYVTLRATAASSYNIYNGQGFPCSSGGGAYPAYGVYFQGGASTIFSIQGSMLISQLWHESGTIKLNGYSLSVYAGSFTNSGGTSTKSIDFSNVGTIVCTTLANVNCINLPTVNNYSFANYTTSNVSSPWGYDMTGGFVIDSDSRGRTITFGNTAGGTSTASLPIYDLTSTSGGVITITSNTWIDLLQIRGGTVPEFPGTPTVNTRGIINIGGSNLCGNLRVVGRGTGPYYCNGSSIYSFTMSPTTQTTATLYSNVSMPGNLTLTLGNINTNGYQVSASGFSSNNSNIRALTLGASTIQLSGSGTVWDTTTTANLTLNANTSNITLTSASTKTFAGGGLTYYNLKQSGAGALTISGNNTFNDILNTVQPTTVTLTSGTTQTVSNFSLSGNNGNLVTLNSSSAGSQATLSKSSGTVSVSYLSIQDSNATGGASWNAGPTSTNVSNNTGWIFVNGAMILMFFT